MSNALRIAICGNTHSGKKTLISRLLFEAHALFSKTNTHSSRHDEKIVKNDSNLALVKNKSNFEKDKINSYDITYQHFKSPSKYFIFVNIPAQKEFTQNMIAAFTNVDLVILVLDASQEIDQQVLEYASLASFMKISKLLVCVNKMDLINFDQDKFNRHCQNFRDKADLIHPLDIDFIPLSSYFDEGVNLNSAKMPWFKDKKIFPLIHDFDQITPIEVQDLRLPIQTCISHDGRIYYGAKLVSGNLEVGQNVYLGENKKSLKINRLYIGDKSVMRAKQSSCVTFTLEQDISLTRGELLYTGTSPHFSNMYNAYIYWINNNLMNTQSEYIIQKNSKQAYIHLESDKNKSKFNDDHKVAKQISYSKITGEQILDFDSYASNKGNGKFILIDPHSKKTVAAGIIDVSQKKSA